MTILSETLLTKYRGRLPEDYILAIAGLAENAEPRRFLNDSDVHAELLIECMVGGAIEANEVRIYSGGLKKKCYFDPLNLTHSRMIRILVDDLKVGESVINSLTETQRKKISIRHVAKKFPHHFFTVGDQSFRYELDHRKASAIANFNEPDTTAKLNARFDSMWEAAGKKQQREAKNNIGLVAEEVL